MGDCRTLQWPDRRPYLGEGWSGLRDVELAPLTGRQQRELARRFFEKEKEKADKVYRLLRNKRALARACRTPLLLVFLCLLVEQRVDLRGATVAGLYGHIVNHL